MPPASYKAILLMAGAPEMYPPVLLTCVLKARVIDEMFVAAPSGSFTNPSPSVNSNLAIATLVAEFWMFTACIVS